LYEVEAVGRLYGRYIIFCANARGTTRNTIRRDRVNLKLKISAVLLVSAMVAAPAFAQGSGASDYSAKCAMCHGADGLSNSPAGKALGAKSLKDPAVVKATDAALTATIKNGKGKMPAFSGKLSDAQIKGVLAYVRTLQKK
jgi:mono/diheme cytochrome c family protein